ncbi:cyclic nucleotide-binding domain protein (macronuclear) [Tetrahymena thermophila SB210]|uniref:Cyclic nucleotide-binding domain protein n=1 Tax=Tetrahymena thermophila (strain SB210) TaxID=312017 RepID=Q22EI3_TETTS|nr:cyclic nucleotide-binding domain protein [Tetrahymena thermophila SB210]EAR83669.3 cyclic nucleotide-binding domain protein [Tetrahymena thermophila SB210]|eukprot:XP_001031332.3 cyclic nucleotide-binding domain protein [Tetrahymena thermophila SB210]
MQEPSISNQIAQSMFDSYLPDNSKYGSVMDQNSKFEENSQNFYNRGANKRKQLFLEENNAEIDCIKYKKDDEQIDFLSNNQLDVFSTRNNLNHNDINIQQSEQYVINSPKQNQTHVHSKGMQQYIDQFPQQAKQSMEYNLHKRLFQDLKQEQRKSFRIQQTRNGSFRIGADSARIRDDQSQQSNNLSINPNFSNALGPFSNNQSMFFINNQLNLNTNLNGINVSSNFQMNTQSGSIDVYKQLKKMNLLTNKHYQVVNDLSYSSSEYNQEKLLSSFNQMSIYSKLLMLKKLQCCIPVLNPETFGCALWDIFYGLSILTYFFFIPINISFNVDLLPLTYTILLFQIVNIIISFIKGYYQQGILILDRKQIIVNYAKTYLFFDLLIIFIFNKYHNILCWLFYGYIVKLKRIIERTDNYFQIIRKYPTLYELSLLFITLLLIGQITGCGFHYIAYKELQLNPDSKTWLQLPNLSQDNNWVSIYIASQYFAFITMMTVGYGDIYPTSSNERIYVIFMTLCSSAIFGYVMNTIGHILQERSTKHSNIQKRKQDIVSYLNDRNIDKSLQIEVLEYLDFSYNLDQKNKQTIDILFEQIPKNLTDQIYIEYFGKIIQQNKILSINFSKESLDELSLKIKEKHLYPNEYLIQKGTQEERVYFLLYGQLEIIIETPNRSPVVFQEIKKQGECIGLRNAFNESEYTYHIKSSEKTATSLFYFEMKDFKEILSKNQKDYEKFCELKDEITFGQQYLDQKCYSCQKYSHSIENCPLITNNISKANTILRYNHIEIQENRKTFVRKKKEKFSCSYLNDVKENIRNFRFILSAQYYPEYQQFKSQIMAYEDEKFVQELPELIAQDGIIIPKQDQYEDENPLIPIELNQLLNNVNLYQNELEKQHSNEISQSMNSYLDAIAQQNNMPLAYSNINSMENNINQIIQQSSNHFIQQQNFQNYSQIKVPSFQNILQQNENPIIDSNLKDSVKELTNKSSRRDRGDSSNLKRPIQSFGKIVQIQAESQHSRMKAPRKQTQKIGGIYTYDQFQQEVQLNNVDHRLYFYQNFETLKNFTKYFPKYNSETIIKKYNTHQNIKKIQQQKSFKNHSPFSRKKKFLRGSIIPSHFKPMIN